MFFSCKKNSCFDWIIIIMCWLRVKKLFYWDSDSIVLQKQQKKNRVIRVFKYWNWTISTFPSIMTACLPNFSSLWIFKLHIMTTCASPSFLTALLSWGQSWFSISVLCFLGIISFMKKPKPKPAEKKRKKETKKPHSKKRKLKQKRYTCHYWGIWDHPM